ncbi:MAG TPA: VanZ family protein [Fimbriimonas sp.]
MRILALSLAYAAGFLASFALLLLDNFVFHGFWLPIVYSLAATLLVLRTFDGKDLTVRLLVGALVVGVPTFWALSIPPEIAWRFPLLGVLLRYVFPSAVGGALVWAVYRWLGRGSRLHGWLTLAVFASLCVAYFSGNTGQAGPMFRWFGALGLTEAQAEAVVLGLRKAVHFLGYGSVAAAAYRGAVRSERNEVRPEIFGFLYAFALACFDEIRQAGAIRRSGSAWDVLLDTAGILAFLWIARRHVPSLRAGDAQS